MRLPKLFFNDNSNGKAIGINMFIGKCPYAGGFGISRGNSDLVCTARAQVRG